MHGLLFEQTARFRVDRDFETDALTSWRAPYTGSEHCTIPAGTMLCLDSDVAAPIQQVRYELIDPPAGEAYVGTVFPASIGMGFDDVREHPEKWRNIAYLTSGLTCYAENHAQLEQQLIPDATRLAAKYSGYWFWLRLTSIGDGIEFIAESREIEVPRNARLYSMEPFECFGLRADGVAVHCEIPDEVVLTPRQAIERRRAVRGWEMTYADFTWWRSGQLKDSLDAAAWTAAERICPSHFLANCDPRFIEAVKADGAWDALLLPTDLLGSKLVLA